MAYYTDKKVGVHESGTAYQTHFHSPDPSKGQKVSKYAGNRRHQRPLMRKGRRRRA